MKLIDNNADLTRYGFTRKPDGWTLALKTTNDGLEEGDISVLITDVGNVKLWAYGVDDTVDSGYRWKTVEQVADVPKVLFRMHEDGVFG